MKLPEMLREVNTARRLCELKRRELEEAERGLAIATAQYEKQRVWDRLEALRKEQVALEDRAARITKDNPTGKAGPDPYTANPSSATADREACSSG